MSLDLSSKWFSLWLFTVHGIHWSFSINNYGLRWLIFKEICQSFYSLAYDIQYSFNILGIIILKAFSHFPLLFFTLDSSCSGLFPVWLPTIDYEIIFRSIVFVGNSICPGLQKHFRSCFLLCLSWLMDSEAIVHANFLVWAPYSTACLAHVWVVNVVNDDFSTHRTKWKTSSLNIALVGGVLLVSFMMRRHCWISILFQ